MSAAAPWQVCWSKSAVVSGLRCDTLANGHQFPTLNVVNDFTGECLAIEVDFSLPGKRVTSVLERLVLFHRSPDCIVLDNGPELTGRAMIGWCMQRNIALEYISPGKPIENAFVESFNGKFPDACLNENWFFDLNDARSKTEDWREDYNTGRPHTALGYLTAKEVSRQHKLSGSQCLTWYHRRGQPLIFDGRNTVNIKPGWL